MKIAESLLTGLLRTPLLGQGVRYLLTACHRTLCGAMKRADRHTVRPRHWSNAELRRIAPLLRGSVINVSGWRDEDKEGGHYRDYFSGADRYNVSNFHGERGLSDLPGEVFLDLESPLPSALKGQYNVAFNHTVLEHVYDIRTAVQNICALSDDVVILVTPFLQHVHYESGSFGDYWRPTPACIERMLADNGFSVIYQTCNDTPWFIVYVFTVAARDPARHVRVIPTQRITSDAGRHHFHLDV